MLVVVEPEAPVSDLFSKDAVFFDWVINSPLLVLVQPTCDAGKGERESQTFANLTLGRKLPYFSSAFNTFEFLHHSR